MSLGGCIDFRFYEFLEIINIDWFQKGFMDGGNF